MARPVAWAILARLTTHAKAASAGGLPYLDVRALSDLAGRDSRFDFAAFVAEVAGSSARILRHLLPVL